MGSGPEEVGSSLSEEELELIRSRFFFQPGFRLETAGPEDRVTQPPPGRIAVYRETLWAGLRFPAHEFVSNLLAEYQLVPAQLAPNSWRTIIGFLSLCLGHGIPISVGLFRRCFLLKKNPADVGWLYFAFRGGMSLFRGAPSSIHEWKRKFFFLASAAPWGFEPRWGHPRLKALNKLSEPTGRELRTLDSLRALGRGNDLTELLREDALASVGLSSARPEGKGGCIILFIYFLFSVFTVTGLTLNKILDFRYSTHADQQHITFLSPEEARGRGRGS